jgi:hypothetical protein
MAGCHLKGSLKNTGSEDGKWMELILAVLNLQALLPES